MSDVARVHKSCWACESCKSHTSMRHITLINESCHAFATTHRIRFKAVYGADKLLSTLFQCTWTWNHVWLCHCSLLHVNPFKKTFESKLVSQIQRWCIVTKLYDGTNELHTYICRFTCVDDVQAAVSFGQLGRPSRALSLTHTLFSRSPSLVLSLLLWAIKHGEDTPTNKVCSRASREAHERDRITNEPEIV